MAGCEVIYLNLYSNPAELHQVDDYQGPYLHCSTLMQCNDNFTRCHHAANRVEPDVKIFA